MVRKIAIAAAKVLQAAAVVAVTVTIEDATREVMVPKTSAITATAAAKFLTAPAVALWRRWFPRLRQIRRQRLRGSSDDPGRDKGSDVALEAITAVLVVTIVADAAAIRSARFYRGQDFGDYGDSGGDVSYGNGGGRSGSDNSKFDEDGYDPIIWKSSAITKTAAADVFFGDRGDRGDSDNPGRDEDVSVPKNGTNNGDYGGGVSYDNDRGGCKDCGNYGDSGGEVSYGDGDGRGGSDGAQNCGNYGNNGGKDSGGNRGGRGNSDNLRRDEGVDADWKAKTTVVVVAIDAMVPNTVVITATATATATETFLVATAMVAVDAMVRKTRYITARAARKVLQATAVVAPTAMIQDETSDSAEDCGNYGDSFYSDRGGRGGRGGSDYPGLDEGSKAAIGLKTVANNGYSGGEVFYADNGCRGVPYGDGGGRDGIANPGRHKDGDFALETITAAVVVTIVADDFIQDRTSVITATAAATFLTAMEVVAAVAVTPDLTRVTESYGSEDCGNYGDSGCESSYSDSDGLGNGDNPGRNEDGDFADNSRRDEGINADWKAITTVVVVAMVADAALTMSAHATEHCGNYGDSGGNISNGDEVVVLKTVVITAKVFTAIAVVAAVAIIQDSMRAAKSPKRR
ncbi:hypothetical protein Bbelb_393680 [Branchiostoma belcheri]|nr:hypothetical protein Bbelb_393680 [Branchiostoma belcheri]